MEAVGCAVGQHAGNDERTERPASRRRPLRAGQDDEHLGVDVGAEELLARQPPFVAVGNGRRGVGADVAATLALGKEHPSLPRALGVGGREPAEHHVARAVGGVAGDDVGGGGRHAHGTDQRRLRLAHEIVDARGHHAGCGPAHALVERRVPGAHEVGLVGQPPGVMHDLVGLLAPVVVTAELRAHLVGDLGAGGERLADEAAVAGEDLFRDRTVARIGEESVSELSEVGVDGVPVEPDGLLVVGVVRKHVRWDAATL